jgi:hypothetical protein
VNKYALLLASFIFVCSPSFAAVPSKDHEVLRTLQSLQEKSLQKRLMTLSAMGPQAYKQLQEISFDSQYPPETRAEAFRTAVTLAQDRSQPEIKRASEHKDWFMRVLALEAYAHLQPAKAQSMARQLLIQDNALMVRAAALGTLQDEAPTEELKEVLLTAFKDQKNYHRGQSLWIRGRIADVLLKFDPKAHSAVYKSLLEDGDAQVRERAMTRLRQAYPEAKLKDATAWLGKIESSTH